MSTVSPASTAAPSPANSTSPGADPPPVDAIAATPNAAPNAATSNVATSNVATAANPRPAPGFWVQLGVFRQRDGAEGFHRRVVADLDWLAPLLAVFSEPGTYRLQAGPYGSRGEAQDVARRVRDALNLVPVIVERR